jgi:hypothetical protein
MSFDEVQKEYGPVEKLKDMALTLEMDASSRA